MFEYWALPFYCLGADVNHRTATNDHSVLSLACAGGHVSVVQYLLMQGSDPAHILKVCSAWCVEESVCGCDVWRRVYVGVMCGGECMWVWCGECVVCGGECMWVWYGGGSICGCDVWRGVYVGVV